MDLTTILTQMLVLFFLMILGLIAQRFGIMDQTFNARLSNLLIKLAVPCMILLPWAGRILFRMRPHSFAC